MRPTDFQKLSVKYLYGEISKMEKKIFEEHLAVCEGCRKEFEEMKQAYRLLEKLPAEDPAISIRGKVLDYAAQYRERKKNLWDYFLDFLYTHKKSLRYATAVLMLFIGITMIFIYLGRTTSNRQTKTSSHAGISSTLTTNNVSTVLTVDLDKKIKQVNRELSVAWLPKIIFSPSTLRPLHSTLTNPFL